MAAPDLVEDVALNTPLTLRCGLTLPNRLVKAAMTEVSKTNICFYRVFLIINTYNEII